MWNLGLDPTIKSKGTLFSQGQGENYNRRTIWWFKQTITCCTCSGRPNYVNTYFLYFDIHRMPIPLGSYGSAHTFALTDDLTAQDGVVNHYISEQNNPPLFNTIPHPSHYNVENDTFMITNSQLGQDFDAQFQTVGKVHLLFDEKRDSYYSIVYSEVNNTFYFLKESNVNALSHKTHKDILIYDFETERHYLIKLYDQKLIYERVRLPHRGHENFYIKDLDYAIKEDKTVQHEFRTYNEFEYIRYFKFKVDTKNEKVIAFKEKSEDNMYETEYQHIIHNAKTSAAMLSTIVERLHNENEFQSFIGAFGHNRGFIQNPFIIMKHNGIMNSFDFDPPLMGDHANASNLFLCLYDEHFTRMGQFAFSELNSIFFDFKKGFMEVFRINGDFHSFKYVGAMETKKVYRYNIQNTKHVYIVFKYLNEDGSLYPVRKAEFFNHRRHFRFRFRPENKAEPIEYFEEYPKGVIEFRIPIVLSNIDTITKGIFNNYYNMLGKYGNDHIDSPHYGYYHGCVGFHYYHEGMHRYRLFVNKFADSVYHTNYAEINSYTEMDIHILHIVRGSSKQFDVYRIDNAFINNIIADYDIVGPVRLLCPNLPIKFTLATNYRYEFIPFMREKVNMWVTRGTHSNLDETKTGIYHIPLKTGNTNYPYPKAGVQTPIIPGYMHTSMHSKMLHTKVRINDVHLLASSSNKTRRSYTGIDRTTMFATRCGVDYKLSYTTRDRNIRISNYEHYLALPRCGIATTTHRYTVTVYFNYYDARMNIQSKYLEFVVSKKSCDPSSWWDDWKFSYEEGIYASHNDPFNFNYTITYIPSQYYYPTTFLISYKNINGNTYSYATSNARNSADSLEHLGAGKFESYYMNELNNIYVNQLHGLNKNDTYTLIPIRLNIYGTKYAEFKDNKNPSYYSGRTYANTINGETLVYSHPVLVEKQLKYNTLEREVRAMEKHFNFPSGTNKYTFMLTTAEMQYMKVPFDYGNCRKDETTDDVYDQYWNILDPNLYSKYAGYPTRLGLTRRVIFRLDNYGCVEGYTDTHFTLPKNDNFNDHDYYKNKATMINKMKFVEPSKYFEIDHTQILHPLSPVMMANIEYK